MKGDFSRDTHQPKKTYTRVLMQQGRVQVDADFNEQAALMLQQSRAFARDMIGPYGGPETYLGFEITSKDDSGNDLAPGRFRLHGGVYYVDGIRVDADCDFLFHDQPYVSGGPLAGDDTDRYIVYLELWERWICYVHDDRIREVALLGPDTCGRAELVWRVGALLLPEDSDCQPDRKPKPGKKGASPAPSPAELDDAGKLKLKLEAEAQVGKLRAIKLPEMIAGLGGDTSSCDPCDISPESKYRGLENQLYRVEIHQGGAAGVPVSKKHKSGKAPGGGYGQQKPGRRPGRGYAQPPSQYQAPQQGYQAPPPGYKEPGYKEPGYKEPGYKEPGYKEPGYKEPGYKEPSDDHCDDDTYSGATFKWSRENGSVIFPITGISEGSSGTTIVEVAHLGRDEKLGLAPGDWVEIVDDSIDLSGEANALLRVESIQVEDLTVVLQGDAPDIDLARHCLLRRWDQKPRQGRPALVEGCVPLQENVWIPIEDGIEVYFPSDNGPYRTGDYWLIPARVATGSIEWPTDPATGDFAARRAHGIKRHYAPLAVIDVPAQGGVQVVADARRRFPFQAV